MVRLLLHCCICPSHPVVVVFFNTLPYLHTDHRFSQPAVPPAIVYPPLLFAVATGHVSGAAGSKLADSALEEAAAAQTAGAATAAQNVDADTAQPQDATTGMPGGSAAPTGSSSSLEKMVRAPPPDAEPPGARQAPLAVFELPVVSNRVREYFRQAVCVMFVVLMVGHHLHLRIGYAI